MWEVISTIIIVIYGILLVFGGLVFALVFWLWVTSGRMWRLAEEERIKRDRFGR